LPASPGAAVGQIVFTADDAEAWHAQGKSVILVLTFDIEFISSLTLYSSIWKL
jgi:phosphoenolpyruvate synthase/pyruvate phosphate dikinase